MKKLSGSDKMGNRTDYQNVSTLHRLNSNILFVFGFRS